MGDVGPDRLEAALRIGEPSRQRRTQDQVVAARDDLTLGPADHAGAAGQPGSDRDVGVARDQRCHQREQRGEIGGQVDVHVGQHLGVGVIPHRVQGAAATLLLQSAHPHLVELVGQPRRDRRRGIDTGVVGDGDPERERKLLGQVPVQPAHRIGKGRLLVVDRHHNVEHRHPPLGGDAGRVAGEPGGCGVVRFECDGHVFMLWVQVWT